MTHSRDLRGGWLTLVAGLLACVTSAAAIGQSTQDAAAAADGAAARSTDAANDAEPNAGAVDAPDDAPDAEPELPEVSVRVQHVSFNESIQFDEEGNERHRHSNLSINLRVKLDGEPGGVASYNGAVIEAAVTSSGERLTSPQNNHWQNRHPIMNRNGFGRGNNEFHANAQLSVPTLAADVIDELRGHVLLSVSRGEVKRAVIRPMSLYDNKTVRVVGIEGMQVRVQRMGGQGMVRIAVPMDGAPLEGVTFLGEDKQAMPTPQMRGSRTSNQWAHQDYMVALGDEAGVVLRWREEVAEVKVPFVVKDVPLPGQRGGGVELSVVAEPIDDAADPLAGLELMEIEVVEEN